MFKINKTCKILIIIMLIIAVIFIAIIGISAVIHIPEKYGVGYIAMLNDVNIGQSDFNELIDYVYNNVDRIRKLMEYDFSVGEIISDEDFLFIVNTLKFVTKKISAEQLTQTIYHGKTKKVSLFNAMTLYTKYVNKNIDKVNGIISKLNKDNNTGSTDSGNSTKPDNNGDSESNNDGNIETEENNNTHSLGDIFLNINNNMQYNEAETLIKGCYSVCNQLTKMTDKELVDELNNIRSLKSSLNDGNILLSNTLNLINFAGFLTVNIDNKGKILHSISNITDSELLTDLSILDKTANLACKIASNLTADDILRLIDYYGDSASFTYGLVKYIAPKLRTSTDLQVILSEIELLMDKICVKTNQERFDLYDYMLRISAANSVDDIIDGIEISNVISQINEFFTVAYSYYSTNIANH